MPNNSNDDLWDCLGNCCCGLAVRHNSAPGIMSGFFEWKTDVQRKRPFKIHLQNKAIMSLAGIWETWRPGTHRTSAGHSPF